jgi:ribosomal protein S18 acetylase RimI-like enzyme
MMILADVWIGATITPLRVLAGLALLLVFVLPGLAVIRSCIAPMTRRPRNHREDLKRIVNAAWRLLAGLAGPSRRTNARRLRRRGETVESFTIRDATAADVPALARAHVEAWNATYAPLLVKGPGPAVRERQWREAFAKDDGSWFCLVVERPGSGIVGFARGQRSDHPAYAGELNKIYLLPAYQGVGLGRRLIGHVARRFLGRGIGSMWLYGDARNPSRRVWLALGAEKTDDDPGNGNYGWRDLRHLAAAPALGTEPGA